MANHLSHFWFSNIFTAQPTWIVENTLVRRCCIVPGRKYTSLCPLLQDVHAVCTIFSTGHYNRTYCTTLHQDALYSGFRTENRRSCFSVLFSFFGRPYTDFFLLGLFSKTTTDRQFLFPRFAFYFVNMYIYLVWFEV